MKVTCNKQELNTVVQNVIRAVSTKSTIPALEGILLDAHDGRLYLSGYDLEIGIFTSIEVQVSEPGKIVLSAKLFSDMIRRMVSDTITIESDERLLVTIHGGMTEYKVLGIAADEFPELPVVSDADSVYLPQQILKSMIDQTLFAIATSDAKPVHTGSLFDIEENMVTIVSVDGYRLAMRKEKISTNQKSSFIVPGKTLSEVAKLLSDDEKQTEILISRKHVVFNIDNYSVISRLLEGDFLDYRTAIPNNATTTVKISTRLFIDSIERTSLLITDRLKSPLRVQFGGNQIKMSCSTAIGKAYDEIDCSIDGVDVEVGFNNKYLLDALRASFSDEVLLQINGPLSPVKVVPLEGDSYLFLVLPVRLKNEA